jgi:outer membrane receptor protein involved in Fe transport
VFEAERVTQWEIDTHWTLLDGKVAGGLTLYRMDLSDFQLITMRPQDLVQVVENVGLLRAQGIESEILAYPFHDWTVLGTLGLNDATYVEFPFGPCPGSRPDIDGDGDPRCDFSGRQLVLTPRWTIGLTPTYSVSVASVLPALREWLPGVFGEMLFQTSVTGLYLDKTHIGNTPLDSRTNRPRIFVFSGRMGFLDPGKGWSVSLQGRDLTDQYINVARLEISGLPDNFADVPEPGRVLFVQARYEF